MLFAKFPPFLPGTAKKRFFMDGAAAPAHNKAVPRGAAERAAFVLRYGKRGYGASAGRRRRGAAAALAAVLGALGLLTLAAYAVFDHYAGKLSAPSTASYAPAVQEHGTLEDSPAAQRQSYEAYLRENLEREAQPLAFDERDVCHILLIGADGGDGEELRSDSMILLSIDRAGRRLVLCSFMRDIYCAIPGYGCSRLNHAYAWGGAALLMETIGENFKIPLTNYVRVDFDGFRAVMDAAGGVDIELTQAEAEYLNDIYRDAGLTAGVNRLDGDTALEYARMRDVGNADYERTARQRRVLTAMLTEARELSLVELNALAEAVLPQIETSLGRAQLLSLLLNAGEYMRYETAECRIPCDGSMTDMVVDGMMVLGIDFERNRRVWYETVYGA